MEGYDHKQIEQKWRAQWEKDEPWRARDNSEKPKYYTLVEFPYPSGNLHVGHWYAFSVPDIFARYQRMKGFNVLYPMGFDAFGLPAENAAIKHKLNPREWTLSNIEYMRNQLRSMGATFDWSREVVTCDPSYYRWTQWLFTQFFKKGLAYQKETEVNWCPSCKTVLANEQVVAGKCERCNTEVEKRSMRQWNLKITDYAPRLLKDLETVSYPEPIKEAQRNWIGESHGAELHFKITNADEVITVFTTRPDTLFGATYVVLSPEHELVEKLSSRITNIDTVRAYAKEASKKAEIDRIAEGREKTGVRLEGVMALNPGNGEEIPIFIADYVLSTYGTGAIMAVPAHDERDHAFATKFDLPIIEVVHGGKGELFEGDGPLTNSGEFTGMNSVEAREKITQHVGGEMKTTYRMRDWIVSRQRYWGCPIPVIHCNTCGPVVVPEQDLPVVLPEIDDYLPTGDGKSPLAKASDWVKTKCPNCGGDASRETDTLDTFIDSSWYFLRYTDPHNEKEFASKEKQDMWMPVDFYSGGAEHTTMHLLYSRFFHKVLFDLGLVSEPEPYQHRMNRGLILGPDGNKMSKSRGNVVDPDEYVRNLGADTVRMYLAFIGPYNEVGSYPWNPDSIVGVRRFLERIVKLSERLGEGALSDDAHRVLHETVKKVGEEIESFKFNTAVSAFMICLNTLEKEKNVPKGAFEMLLKTLAPFVPFLTEELWERLGYPGSVHQEAWPAYDPQALVKKEIYVIIQVDGKVRGKVSTYPGATQDEILSLVYKDEKVVGYLGGREPERVVFVPDRLISFVMPKS
ncbi:MAG: leucine--tRNA ligase [Candidatus Campbellbacteria bacterium]